MTKVLTASTTIMIMVFRATTEIIKTTMTIVNLLTPMSMLIKIPTATIVTMSTMIIILATTTTVMRQTQQNGTNNNNRDNEYNKDKHK